MATRISDPIHQKSGFGLVCATVHTSLRESPEARPESKNQSNPHGCWVGPQQQGGDSPHLASDYRRRKRELACAERQQFRQVQFGHGRILRFLDDEDPSLRLDHNPALSRLSCLPANRARKGRLYLASLRLSLKKLMRSIQRLTIRSDHAFWSYTQGFGQYPESLHVVPTSLSGNTEMP